MGYNGNGEGGMPMLDIMYQELVQGLVAILPDQLSRVVLYGSTARGTATPQSDVDIALLITRPLTLRQQDALSDLVTDLNLKYDKVLSVVDIDLHTYLHWRHVAPFYQNVDKDGIVLWKAA